jgi:asparagine synthase (glutamine-hydrolysing)
MCGIAGIVGNLRGSEGLEIESMLHEMTHRGPDQEGTWSLTTSNGGVILGHRRLSILDLSEAGKQPMVDESSGISICYNGECYNYLELRSELKALGHTFVSDTDTEVVLAAYLQWGDLAIQRFRGMFAVAIWDPGKETILLARDRLGIKPLYYAQSSGRVYFASEIRALLASGQIRRQIEPRAVNSYLWHGFVPGPYTIVRGVRLLESGSSVRVGVDGSIDKVQRFWDIPNACVKQDEVLAKEAATNELSKAVDLRLVSDVPLGVFLSGGVDSSVVATLAQRASSTPIKTFNIKFEEADYDESQYAIAVAKALGTEHEEILMTESHFYDGLEAAIASLDQPTFDGINTYFVSRAVREAGLTVALSGAGGDELFGGYSSFIDVPKAARYSKLTRHIPASAIRILAKLGARVAAGEGSEIPPQTRFGKIEDLLLARGDLIALYQVSYSLFTRDFQEALRLSPDLELNWGLYPEIWSQLQSAISDESELASISRLELTSFIGERLLRDTDTTSMANSLEVRVPLLDHKFIESLSSLTEEYRFHPLRKKEFLKDAMMPEVPRDIFDRPKAGFEFPLELWCRRMLVEEMDAVFMDLKAITAVGLNCETVNRTWRAFKKGGAGIYWSRVWALFILISWCKRHKVYL